MRWGPSSAEVQGRPTVQQPQSTGGNRFQALSEGGTESDTESIEGENQQEAIRRPTRLRLMWSPAVEEVGAGAIMNREARAAIHFVRSLARRIGVVQRGDPLPRALRQQRWSPLNVPLMWLPQAMTPVIRCRIGWSSKESTSQWSSTEATPRPRRQQERVGRR